MFEFPGVCVTICNSCTFFHQHFYLLLMRFKKKVSKLLLCWCSSSRCILNITYASSSVKIIQNEAAYWTKMLRRQDFYKLSNIWRLILHSWSA
jgi:hypothetical protein